MTRLSHDPMRARRVDGPQDGADVVRIFDAVQDDDERRALGGGDEFLDAEPICVANVSDNALVCAALREAIEFTSVGPTDGYALAGSQPSDLGVAVVRPCGNAKSGHSSGAKGFEHGVDAVDSHG
jgi:hypothetical protein